MISFARRHFPANRTKFMRYFRIFLPIILGSTLYALNGVVDNFMVGHVEQGVSALGAINAWTGILIGWFVATASAGSVILAQFYYKKNYEVVRQISRYRFLLAFLPSIPLFIVAQTAPDVLTKVFLHRGDDEHAYALTLINAREYAKIISFQWLVFSFAFNFGNQLREMGHSRVPMLWGIGTLATNMTLNAILMYGYQMGVAGAAWASFSARIFAISVAVIYIYIKKLPIDLNFFRIWQTPFLIQKIFWRRWVYVFSIFTIIFFIIFRTSLYARGYPTNDSLGKGVYGLSVLGLTGALMNIFTTTFSALASMAAVFVASELGKGNLDQAKINADELKGFNTVMALALACLTVMFASFLPWMHFLSRNQYDSFGVITFDASAQLTQVKYSLYVIALFYPMWIWFSTSYRNSNAGGKGQIFSFIEWLISGLQLGWLAIITIYIVPAVPAMQHWFALSYLLFFISDFFKLFFIEWFYYRDRKWLHSITMSEYDQIDKQAQDRSEMMETFE